ncbi:MAG: MCE family protein [Chthoniobacterales bacterium]|nr:MCE family protein [Chthoniobacterales bacterium]
MNNRSDIVVAAVVVVCSLALLGALVTLVGGGSGLLSRPTLRFTVDFADITGIGRNSDVFYAGDRIGRVESIEHLEYGDRQRPDLSVRAHVAVTREMPLAANLRATIGAPSLLGEKHLALLPLDSGGEVLAEGAQLTATQGAGMLDQLIPGGDALIADLREIVASLRSVTTPLVKDDAGRKIAATLENLEQFTAELNRIMDGGDGQPGAGAQLTDAVGKIDRAATGLQNLVLGPEGRENEGISARTDVTLKNVENVSRELNLMLAGSPGSPGLRQRMDDITAELQTLLKGGDGPGLGRRLDDVLSKTTTLVEELNVLTVWGGIFTGTLAGRPNRLIFGGRQNDLPTKEEIIDHLRRTRTPFPSAATEEPRRSGRRTEAPAATPAP